MYRICDWRDGGCGKHEKLAKPKFRLGKAVGTNEAVVFLSLHFALADFGTCISPIYVPTLNVVLSNSMPYYTYLCQTPKTHLVDLQAMFYVLPLSCCTLWTQHPLYS